VPDATVLLPEFLLGEPRSDALQSGAGIAVRNGAVADIADVEKLRLHWSDATFVELPDCLVMPGLVNAHQHGRGLSQVQLGYRDDYLETWIASRRGRGVLNAYAVTKLAAASMVMHGVTTTVHANYSYGSGDYEAEVRAQLKAYRDIGIRVAMCVGAMDRGSVVYPPHEACFMAGLPADLKDWLSRPGKPAYADGADATIALMNRLRADFQGDAGIRLCYGPAGPQWVSDELWRALARDAADRGLGIHFHALESPAQRDAAKELYPQGVFAFLEQAGAMTERSVIAHGVWVDDADMEIIARTGATVVRNASSNLRLRNGIAPLARYLQRGVRVAVGTDNTALTDDEDLLQELRLAANLAREPDWNGPPPPTVDQLLAMATVNGAIAAQFAPEVGTLAPGMRADLIAVSLDRVRLSYLDADMPLLEALLARVRGGDVRLTMIDGEILYRDGRLTNGDIEEIESAAAATAQAARLPHDSKAREHSLTLREHLCCHYQSVSKPNLQQ
jgi:5-methylthioadenosine/S-adenosylhomocysteine deaminase